MLMWQIVLFFLNIATYKTMYLLDENAAPDSFPPVEEADPISGCLAMGGRLTAERVRYAYKNGVFPWYDEDLPPLWYAPDPRFVLLPENFRFSKSMRPILRKKKFHITLNQHFPVVLRYCAEVREETWITQAQERAFLELQQEGMTFSVEAWEDGKLAGGLYGGLIGNSYFGESMFTLSPNASKAALIVLAQNLWAQGCEFIDCQVYTENLARFGAKNIPRKTFMKKLEQAQHGKSTLSLEKLEKNWSTESDFLLQLPKKRG